MRPGASSSFFAATRRNRNTPRYAWALSQFFGWCEDRGIQRLDQIEPMMVAAYIRAALTVRQLGSVPGAA
jgi:hypothetical protein